MLAGPRSLLLLPLAALLGCGSSPSNMNNAGSTGNTGNTNTTTPYNFNGNWVVVSTSPNSRNMPISAFDGALQVSNGVVTGKLVPLGGSAFYNLSICQVVIDPAMKDCYAA